jgi:6-phosphofructokinase
MAKKRIGILTGGGDVPGLNAVIKSVTYRSSENDIEVFGFRRGWEGLTEVNLEDPTSRSHYVIPLNRENTRTIDRRGGSAAFKPHQPFKNAKATRPPGRQGLSGQPE